MYSTNRPILISNKKPSLNKNKSQVPLSVSTPNKKKNPQKKCPNNPELESAKQIVKVNSLSRNVALSPIENKIESIKRNIFLKTENTPYQKYLGDNLLNNPYISNEVKNKYSEIYSETLTNKININQSSNNKNDNQKADYVSLKTEPNTNSVLARKAKQFGCELKNDSIYNKKRDIYLLLSNEDNSECNCRNEEEINQKIKELSNKRYFLGMTDNKVLFCKKQIEKIVESVNRKKYINSYNHKEDKIMLLAKGKNNPKDNEVKNKTNICLTKKMLFHFNSPLQKKEKLQNNNKTSNTNENKTSGIHRRCLSFY